MLLDLQQCSTERLHQFFSSLDECKDYVFWIRNADHSEQIYVSAHYETIWCRDRSQLFEAPLIWADYLCKEIKYECMKQMHRRHVLKYMDIEKNLIFYQIDQRENKIGYMMDRCFKCQSQTGSYYVVGIAKRVSREVWYEQYNQKHLVDQGDLVVYQEFFNILKRRFGLLIISQLSNQEMFMGKLNAYLVKELQVKFSQRELQCLAHFCQGKTYKETARDMSISPRTVETYLNNILQKSSCNNKVEVVSKFSQYFVTSIHNTKLSTI